ncbi:unnamed protein product, partial [Closterium sp. Yama58-4]
EEGQPSEPDMDWHPTGADVAAAGRGGMGMGGQSGEYAATLGFTVDADVAGMARAVMAWGRQQVGEGASSLPDAATMPEPAAAGVAAAAAAAAAAAGGGGWGTEGEVRGAVGGKGAGWGRAGGRGAGKGDGGAAVGGRAKRGRVGEGGSEAGGGSAGEEAGEGGERGEGGDGWAGGVEDAGGVAVVASQVAAAAAVAAAAKERPPAKVSDSAITAREVLCQISFGSCGELGGSGGEGAGDARMYTANGGLRRKHHRPWTLREVMILVDGVARCGGGKWADIKKLAFASIGYRTAVDLKDKWRNLLRASKMALQPPKEGEQRKKAVSASIPPAVLARVRELAQQQEAQAHLKLHASAAGGGAVAGMAGSLSGDELANGKALVPFLQRADELQKHDPLVAYYCRLYAMDKGLRVPSKERSQAVNALLVSIMSRLEKDKAALQLSPDDGLHVEGFAQRVFSKADKQDRAGRADMCVVAHGVPWRGGIVGTSAPHGAMTSAHHAFPPAHRTHTTRYPCHFTISHAQNRSSQTFFSSTPSPPPLLPLTPLVPSPHVRGRGTAKTFYAAGIFFEVCRQFGELAPEVEQKQRYAVWKAADIRRALADGRRPTPGPPGGDADAAAANAPALTDAAASASAPAMAPPAAPSFPSADSLDAIATGGAGRLQVARPVGGGSAAMQPNPHAQANLYSQGHGDYSQAPQGQAAQAAQAWQQSTLQQDSGAAAANPGAGAAGGTSGALPSQASPHSGYGGGGGGVASGGGARAGQNVASAANGSTATGSFSNSQGPGPREIADAHKAARYAVSALAGMAETEASPHFTASLDTYVLRPLQRASSIMGSGDLWQRAADMDEVVAEAHSSVANTAATTTNEGAATGKKWSVMGSTARKVQRMLFADKSDRSASIADRKTKRLLPSLLSSARRQERSGQDLSQRGGSCRVESAEGGVDDGGERVDDLGRRSVSFQHVVVDSYGEMFGRDSASAEEPREGVEFGGADPEGRADGDSPDGRAGGADSISFSLHATSATGVLAGVDQPCSVNEHAASPPKLNRHPDRIISALPRPVRPQTAPCKSAASLRHFDARDPIFSRRKASPVAPAVLRESVAAASGDLEPQLADEPLLVSASEWSSAALAIVAPPPPPIDAPLALPLPSPVVPRPPSSDGVGSRSVQVASVAQWCTFNIIMILVNNEIFQRYGFTFPLTLTAIHFALSFVGAFTAIEILHVCPKAAVEAGEMVAWVMPMAVVTCFNVVLGQLSLRYVPLPALLSTKALSPGLTVVIQALALQADYDWRLCLSLLPVMAGAMLAYAPSVHFALPTFLSALCCVVLGCATVICAEVLLKGKHYSLDSINALYQLVPYSALILAPPAAVLEGWQLWGWFVAQANPWPAVIAILISGCFAFCLNFSLFYTIQKTSALTFNVAGNLKLVITLVFSWLLFRTPMAPISLLGCLLELVGVVCYGWAIFSLRKRQVEIMRSPSAQVRVEQEASDDIVQVYLGAML